MKWACSHLRVNVFMHAWILWCMCSCVCASGHSFMFLCIPNTFWGCVIFERRPEETHCMQCRGRSGGRQIDASDLWACISRGSTLCGITADIQPLLTHLSRDEGFQEVLYGQGGLRSTNIWEKFDVLQLFLHRGILFYLIYIYRQTLKWHIF